MSEVEPIIFRPDSKARNTGNSRTANSASHKSVQNSTCHLQIAQQGAPVCFDRIELNQILTVYGRKVALGDWRDYAMDFGKDKAVFSIYRRASESPLYRIEKSPKLARKQGAYAVISAHGLVLKRGRDLRRVLDVLNKTLRLVEG